jgi:hypothetical protein
MRHQVTLACITRGKDDKLVTPPVTTELARGPLPGLSLNVGVGVLWCGRRDLAGGAQGGGVDRLICIIPIKCHFPSLQGWASSPDGVLTMGVIWQEVLKVEVSTADLASRHVFVSFGRR